MRKVVREDAVGAVGQAALMDERPSRDVRLDLMRVLGSMAVVVIHASVVMTAQFDTGNIAWWLTTMASAAGRYGSAIFVMVAGAVLLSQASQGNTWSFISKRWARLLPAIVFWSLFYLLWRQWMWGGVNWRSAVHDLARGMPSYHLWFIFMLLGLYPLIPALRMVVSDVSKRRDHYALLIICAVMTIVEAACQNLLNQQHASFLGLSPMFVVYLLAGHLFYRDRPLIPSWLLMGVPVVCLTMMVLGVAILHPSMGETSIFLLHTNRGPLAMGLTFCLFLGLLRLDLSRCLLKVVRPLAPLTLGIYLIHPFWIDMLGRWGWGLKQVGPAWPLIAITAYVLSALSALCFSRLPGLRKVV